MAQTQQKAKDVYLHLAGSNDARAGRGLRDVVPAAYFQRVDTLFVAEGVQKWGCFSPDENTVVIHEAYQTGDDDLLDLAAVHTLLNGGEVYVTPAADMPTEVPVAAIFRY